MPQPLYMSNDGKRVGTIAAMRAYEAETGAPLSSEQEDIIQGRAAAAEQEMLRNADMRWCVRCHGDIWGPNANTWVASDDARIGPLCHDCFTAYASAAGRGAPPPNCPDCAENRPLIEAVKDAVISVSRIDPDSKNHAKQISEFWSAVDLEFRRIYGHPE